MIVSITENNLKKQDPNLDNSQENILRNSALFDQRLCKQQTNVKNSAQQSYEDVCIKNSIQENNQPYTNLNSLYENNLSLCKFDSDESSNKFMKISNSSTTCKSITTSSAIQENCIGQSYSSVIEETNLNQNPHYSESFLNNPTITCSYNEYFCNENQGDLTKGLPSINSLHQIQLSSFKNICEEYHSSGPTLYIYGNNKDSQQYLKNSNMDCLIIPKEGDTIDVEQKVFQINKIPSDQTNFGNIIIEEDNSLRTLKSLQQNQINKNNQILRPSVNQKNECMNIQHYSFEPKDNNPILHQQPHFSYQQNHFSSNFPIQMNINQYVPYHQYPQQLMKNDNYIQQINFEQKNEEYQTYTDTLSSQTPNSNECIPSNDQDIDSSSSNYSQKLKIEQISDDIQYKREEISQENTSHYSENNNNNLLHLVKTNHEEEKSMQEENMEECCDIKKEDFIKKITDQSSQEYWNKFSERDDEYLLKLYEKIDKNNVNKNILSSFLRYILEKGDDIVVECLDSKQKELNTIRKELKNFTRNKKLNNNTINSFFNSKRYSEQFQYYLKFYAMDYFTKSKVKDKCSHYICITYFLRCFYNSTLRENIVIYNKSKYFKTINKKRYFSTQQNQEESTIASQYIN